VDTHTPLALSVPLADAHPTQDEFYHRYLTKNNLFEPVMAAFQANGDRYNLLNSAVIELVDFIRRENIKSLVAHLMEHFGEMFRSVDYVQVRACLHRCTSPPLYRSRCKGSHCERRQPGLPKTDGDDSLLRGIRA
jgi:hypothetical protein